MAKDKRNGYVDISNDTSDVMWMKMALITSRAEVTKHAEGKPSVRPWNSSSASSWLEWVPARFN